MLKSEIIAEYEQMLLGEREFFSSKVFKPTRAGQKDFDAKAQSDIEKQQNAKMVLKYAFDLLGWTESELKECINFTLLRNLKLYSNCNDNDVKKTRKEMSVIEYVGFPSILDCHCEDDLKYLVNYIYTGSWGYSETDMIMEKYQKYLDNEIKVSRKFFDNDYTLYVCMIYFIARYYPTESKKWYKMCANPEIGPKILEASKLKDAAKARGWSALDLLHRSLPEKYRSEWLYDDFHFKKNMEKAIKNERRYGKEE